MADSILQRFDIEPELIKGSNGAFEVHLDDRPVFSKAQTGRFPYDDEVENALGERLGP